MTTFRLIVEIASGAGLLGGMALWAVRMFRRLNDGMKCLLRADMMKTYYGHVGGETLCEYEKKNFLLEYAAYKALGGNSFIDDISADVRRWKVTS